MAYSTLSVNGAESVSAAIKSIELLKLYTITIVMKAAGSTRRRFSLNLSLIELPVVAVAAMVVSESNERLSPSMAALTMIPASKAGSKESWLAIVSPMGKKAAMVPIEEPSAVAIMLTPIKSPGRMMLGERSESVSAVAA